MSRNFAVEDKDNVLIVAPREGRVSRNSAATAPHGISHVAPREGRVSRNAAEFVRTKVAPGRAPRGACE